MASLLDLSLVSYFSNIFVILFIFAASYAVLTFKGPFGPNKGINALIAATLALVFIFSQDAIDVIKETVPWFVVMLVCLMLVLMVTTSIGATMPATIMQSIGNWVLIIGVIVLVINISHHVGQNVGPYLSNETTNTNVIPAGGSGTVGSGDFSQNFGATLFHPKVLALLLVIIIAVFSVLWIGYVGPL
jgi:hypothetical protein